MIIVPTRIALNPRLQTTPTTLTHLHSPFRRDPSADSQYPPETCSALSRDPPNPLPKGRNEVRNKKRKNRNLIHLFCPFFLPCDSICPPVFARLGILLPADPTKLGRRTRGAAFRCAGQPRHCGKSTGPNSASESVGLSIAIIVHHPLLSQLPPSSTSLSLLHPTSNNPRHRWPCARSLPRSTFPGLPARQRRSPISLSHCALMASSGPIGT